MGAQSVSAHRGTELPEAFFRFTRILAVEIRHTDADEKIRAAFKTLQQARNCSRGGSLTFVMMARCLLGVLCRGTADPSAVSAEKLTGTLQACLRRVTSVDPVLGEQTEKVRCAIEKGDYAEAETQLVILDGLARK